MTRFAFRLIKTFVIAFAMVPAAVTAQTYNIPFSDIQAIIAASDESPDAAIRAYLAGLLHDELATLGFDVNGGLILDGIALPETTETIETDCNFPRPYKIHTDAADATVLLDDGSGLIVDLDSIRSIGLHADLIGTVDAETDAWVRWGQDVPFGGNCKTIATDHGWVGLTLPFDISLDLALDLNPSFDSDLIAIVIDKQATLAGQAQIGEADLRHDFGTLSLTDALINLFEDDILESLQTNGEQAVADEIANLNLRLDGLDENGLPDPAIVAFNGPTVFALEVDDEDQAFVRDLLQELGIPEYVIEMLGNRGIEILLQLAILEGAEREAYLAELGATASCDVLLAAFETPLPSQAIYALDNQVCEIADVAGPSAGNYFSDAQCGVPVAFDTRDVAEFCATRFGDQAEATLGNAASWLADSNQPNDTLPTVASRLWTTIPSTQLDLGVLRIENNHQPYMKQLSYKTVLDVPRGNGSCELEMRVYKNDINEQNLKPLMALHGGTWQHRGFSFFGLEASISHMTERGFIVFAPFYRLVDDSDGNVECNGSSWREVTADVESALDWINENGSALGALDGPVSVFGQSAGAHLSAWLAAKRPSEIRKALLFYAPTDMLEFLHGALQPGGPYEDYRNFGLRSISSFFGAERDSQELRLDQIDFTSVTPVQMASEWSTLIPDSVFNLSQLDPASPPAYLNRCALLSGTDLLSISLAAPPTDLLNCLKQDLSEFLVGNSFNHQLADEAVPIHLLHGSADTLVPYTQATGLCSAINGSAVSEQIVEPLTSYDCGAASQVQIVQDADHALELGVCLGSLCPAGEYGSTLRAAAETAIGTAYDWLLVAGRLPEPDPVSLFALSDLNANGSPDIGLLMRGITSLVRVRDGSTGDLIGEIDFGTDATTDADLLSDLNGNGAPEIALLGTMPSGEVRVQIKDSANGSVVKNSSFGSQYSAAGMSIMADYNGNGLPELAVMGWNQGSGALRVMVRDAASSTFLNNLFLGSQVVPHELLAVTDTSGNGIPELGVLGLLSSNNQVRLQVWDAGTSAFQSNMWFGTVYQPHTTITMPDINGNGSDEIVAMGVNTSTQSIRIQIRDSLSGATLRNIWLGNTNSAVDLAIIGDTNGNGSPDIAVLLETPTGAARIRIQDGLSGAFIRNVFYNSISAPADLAVMADMNGNASDELAVLGKTATSTRVLINDSATGAPVSSIDF